MTDPRRSTGQRAALIALGLTGALCVAKLVVWGQTGSLSVLTQALDSMLDVVALLLVFFAVRIAGKPADAEHHYGHGKAENLAAFTQTLFLGTIVAGVAIEAVGRLTGRVDEIDTPWYGFALLGVSAVVDLMRVRILTSAAREEGSEALRAGALNFATDVGTALVALVSLAAVRIGVERADSIGSLIVAAAVGVAAYRLGKRSVDVLMDRAPRSGVDEISRAAASAPGVEETRRVRVRGSGETVFADVTVAAGRTTSLERAHDIAELVEQEIARVAPGADVVVHVEPATGESGLVERVKAAASRIPEVHEVHNVLVHAFDENGNLKLHVTLHAKVLPNMSLEEAHALSDRIEEIVAKELGSDARVDSHIEPLETTTHGRDVTAERADLVDSVRKLATAEPEILDCHEVIVTSSSDQLSILAHVHARGDLPLERIHAASERVEKAVHAAHPDVGAVVIHFEPM